MGNIFIPKICKVGFQQRDDTFTKKLAYVIYYDAKGKLRKEKSWETWRHKPDKGMGYSGGGKKPTQDVTPYDFDNVPTSGFVLNKGHTRYAWSSFGERRTVIRIYDPRGVEFEITPENLVALLMHTDCDHREIQGELVYAWCGTELMLIPCSSEEYESAKEYTALQGVRVMAKDLKDGFTYATKNTEQLVYLGRHSYFEEKYKYDHTSGEHRTRKGKKFHIFCDLEGKNFKPIKSVPNTISKEISEACHDEFANWVDVYLKTPESAAIVKWEQRPLPKNFWEKAEETKDQWYGHGESAAMVRDGGGFQLVKVAMRSVSQGSYFERQQAKEKALSYVPTQLVAVDGSLGYCGSTRYGDWPAVIDKTKFFRLFAVFDNGLKKEWS